MDLVKRKKRYCLTLLEMTISFFLIGILLSALWGMYHHWLLASQKNQKMQLQLHKTFFVKERLDKISELTAIPSNQEDTPIFTPQEKVEGFSTVCFSYLGGADPDPSFNGQIRSLLYLNSVKQLCLATWSTDKQKTRIDILLQKVSSLALSYFDPQTNRWRADWPESFHHLPVWMRLQTEGEETLDLLFRFDRSFEPILYLERPYR